MFTADITCC